MLKKINLHNFKSFSDSEISLSPLTLLAGLNNSGKSSVIQSIRMLWKYYETGDPTLPHHGTLSELKNISSSKLDPIQLEFLFHNTNIIKLKIDFNKSKLPELTIKNTSEDSLPFLNYVGADRWGPKVNLPVYTALGDLTHVGEFGEYVIDLISRHELDIVHPTLKHPKAEGDTLEFNIRAWLQEISPDIEFRHNTDVKRDTSYATINGFRPTNTGFGLSYTLPIIVSLLHNAVELKHPATSHSSIVLLENPEAHLHPKGQTEIGKLIARAAASGKQIIVETHSDHLMDGVRIAVKEGLLPAKETTFHYFTKEKAFKTTIESPQLHSDGKLDFWPDGFFDQTLKNRSILARRR